MTRREMALALALTAIGLWLLWAGRQEGGPRTVLATAGLWWLAALQATWQVWVPAGVVLAGLYVAIPPRRLRRRWQDRLQRPPEAVRNLTPEPSLSEASDREAVKRLTPADREPTQDSTPEQPQAVTPASTPAPVRTVWDAFTVLHQERDDGAAS